MAQPTAAIVSFRLGLHDGVSIEAAKWRWALEELGWRVVTVAGDGPVDHLLPGLAIGAPEPPSECDLDGALSDAEMIVVENICSLPLNPPAAEMLGRHLSGRPTILHHHDLPWQRPHFLGWPPPPDDPAWIHVAINDVSRHQLSAHAIEATVIRNAFDPLGLQGERVATRRSLGVDEDRLLVLQPTRALPRKNVAGGLALAVALGAVYWLLGPAEDGFEPELERLLQATSAEYVHGPGPAGSEIPVADAYAACDVVCLPSTWEGFGNPALESALVRRPLAIGRYPVARELAAFGFQWFAHDQPEPLAAWLHSDKPTREPLLEHNFEIASRHFNLADLPARIDRVIERLRPYLQT